MFLLEIVEKKHYSGLNSKAIYFCIKAEVIRVAAAVIAQLITSAVLHDAQHSKFAGQSK